MKQNISKRDWESVSAYVDGQLSAKKLARFEARLSQDPILQEALQELHDTRLVLQNTPRIRAPRNFLLSVEMVGKPRQLPRLAPAFGWVSVIASLLFVFIVMGDFVRGSGGAISVSVNDVTTQPAAIAEVAPKGSVPQTESNEASLTVPSAGGLSEFSAQEIPTESQANEFVAASEMELESEPTPTLEPEMTQQSEFEMVAEAPQGEGVTISEAVTQTTRSLPTDESASASEDLVPTETTSLPVQEGGHHIEKTATKEPDFGAVAVEPSITDLPPTTVPTAEIALFADSSFVTPETGMEDAAVSSAETSPGENWDVAAPQEQTHTDRTDNLFTATKILLLLLAVGAGIAGLYLRQRGG